MRSIAAILLALACVLGLAAGASGEDRYSIALQEVGVDGQRHALSIHESVEVFALSPDRTQFAYVPSLPDGTRSNELKVGDVRGGGERLLVRAPYGIWSAAWAPNGRTIALSVASPVPNQPVAGIYLVEPDGTGLRRIADYDFGRNLEWSPDSKLLAMDRRVDNQPPELISVLSVETGVTRDLTAGAYPQWSPDGRLLVFQNTASRRIGVVPATGGAVRGIATGFWPSWSPDGKRIAFHRNAGKITDALWVVSSRGGRPRLLVKWASSSMWSPNGRTIAFVKLRYAFLCGPRFRSTLGLVRLRDGKTRRLVVTRRALSLLAWSPDSRRLLYSTLVCPAR